METNSKDPPENSETSGPHTFRFIENHYFSLPSQGNVYTFIPLKSTIGNTRILIASLQRMIFCIEYSGGEYVVHENQFPCIPNGAEIVSVDAYSKNNRWEVGLTMILKDGASEQFVLNLYSDWDVGMPSCFNQEITNCTSIQLNYLPYVLYHTSLPSSTGTEIVWLLSGSDRSIHLYHMCKETNRYQASPSKERLFPELGQVYGVTLNMDIWYSQDLRSRKTVTSGESGNVHIFDVALSNFDNPVIKASREINFDFPSSSVKIFHRRNKVPSLVDLDIDFGAQIDGGWKTDVDEPLMLVTTTLESCFVYSTVSLDRLGFPLPESDSYDVVTSSLLCDVDFDGNNEIVLGTYGQRVLIYKEGPQSSCQWKLMKTHSLPSPVLALAYEDVLGDGAKELIVSTMSGVHILQVDPAFASAVILRRLRKLRHSKF